MSKQEIAVQIKIANLRTHTDTGEKTLYIGRDKGKRNHFGNPFTHLNHATLASVRVATREHAIDAYDKWLDGSAHQETEPTRRKWILEQLAAIAIRGDDLTLLCFCAPQACHGDILARRITDYASNYADSTACYRTGAAAGVLSDERSTAQHQHQWITVAGMDGLQMCLYCEENRFRGEY
jgi:hypothetical protein